MFCEILLMKWVLGLLWSVSDVDTPRSVQRKKLFSIKSFSMFRDEKLVQRCSRNFEFCTTQKLFKSA